LLAPRWQIHKWNLDGFLFWLGQIPKTAIGDTVAPADIRTASILEDVFPAVEPTGTISVGTLQKREGVRTDPSVYQALPVGRKTGHLFGTPRSHAPVAGGIPVKGIDETVERGFLAISPVWIGTGLAGSGLRGKALAAAHIADLAETAVQRRVAAAIGLAASSDADLSSPAVHSVLAAESTGIAWTAVFSEGTVL
jgi:hypothetical protein